MQVAELWDMDLENVKTICKKVCVHALDMNMSLAPPTRRLLCLKAHHILTPSASLVLPLPTCLLNAKEEEGSHVCPPPEESYAQGPGRRLGKATASWDRTND